MNTNDTILLAVGLSGGVVLTVLGAVILHWLQTPRLEIGYQVKHTPMVAPSEHAKSDQNIRILYADEEVPAVHAFDIRVRNTGNKHLEKLPLMVEVSPGGKLFRLDVKAHGRSEVGEIAVSELAGDNTGTATLSFLNKGDEVRVTAVVASADTPQCSLRVPMPGVRCKPNDFMTIPEALVWSLREDNWTFPLAAPLALPLLIVLIPVLGIAGLARRKRD